MILIGECCGPCAGGGGGGGGGGFRDRITLVTGLIASEADGQFSITLQRQSNFGGAGVIRVRWNSSGAACACPHMIPTLSGTVTWGDLDMTNKTVTIPLIPHGPPVFYTCPGQPVGGESGQFTLTLIQGSADVDTPWALSAVCTHVNPYQSYNPYTQAPKITYHSGSAVQPGAIAFPGQPAFQKMVRLHKDADGVEIFREETIVGADGAITSFKRRGDLNSYSPPEGLVEEIMPTYQKYQNYLGYTREIILSIPQPVDAKAIALDNMALAKAFDSDNSWLTTSYSEPNLQQYPEAGWDISFRATDPYGGPWTVPHRGYPPPQAPFVWPGLRANFMYAGFNWPFMATMARVDARGRLVGAPWPVRIELRVLTYRFTNPAQTEWEMVEDSNWVDITDTAVDVNPPDFYGFKVFQHRTLSLNQFLCHPGYVPP